MLTHNGRRAGGGLALKLILYHESANLCLPPARCYCSGFVAGWRGALLLFFGKENEPVIRIKNLRGVLKCNGL